MREIIMQKRKKQRKGHDTSCEEILVGVRVAGLPHSILQNGRRRANQPSSMEPYSTNKISRFFTRLAPPTPWRYNSTCAASQQVFLMNHNIYKSGLYCT
jgi:hypothetical protein